MDLDKKMTRQQFLRIIGSFAALIVLAKLSAFTSLFGNSSGDRGGPSNSYGNSAYGGA
jgi:hypothetical protein